MERFGIFKKLDGGRRVLVGVHDDAVAASTEALLLKEGTRADYLVFGLKSKRKTFDTELHGRHLKKWNDMKGRPGKESRPRSR
jgi:hypothetical protein